MSPHGRTATVAAWRIEWRLSVCGRNACPRDGNLYMSSLDHSLFRVICGSRLMIQTAKAEELGAASHFTETRSRFLLRFQVLLM